MAVGAFLAAMSRLPFVAGIDRYLPPAFGRLHPRWGTPHVSLIVQALCCVVFVLLGQLGSTVHGAYEVLVSMSIITTFVPYLFMFAALIRLQREPAGPEIVRVPGGKPVAIGSRDCRLRCDLRRDCRLGDSRSSEPNKALVVIKIVLLSLAVVGGGAGLYAVGKWRDQQMPRGRV